MEKTKQFAGLAAGFAVWSAGFLGLTMLVIQAGRMMKLDGALVVVAISLLGIIYAGAVIAMAFRTWRRRDEAQREASTWASKWGGQMGMLMTVPILFALEFYVVPGNGAVVGAWLSALRLPAGLHTAFMLGLAAGCMAIIIPRAAGEILGKAFWWWKHR